MSPRKVHDNPEIRYWTFISCEITKQQLYFLVYYFVQSLGPDPQLGQLGRGLCGWHDVKRWHSSSPLQIFRSHSKVKKARNIQNYAKNSNPPHEDESIKGTIWLSVLASFQAQNLRRNVGQSFYQGVAWDDLGESWLLVKVLHTKSEQGWRKMWWFNIIG